MKRILLLCGWFLLLGWPTMGREWPALTLGKSLKAGLAVTDITPPVGYRLSGYFYERLSTGTHDPLQAKAIVFQQGNQTLALVTCDLIGVSAELTDAVRQKVFRQTGIMPQDLMLAATHTHTGPLYEGTLRDYLHQAAVRKYGKDPYEGVDYPAILVERLVEVVRRAQRDLQPVQLDVGSTTLPGLAFNRRFYMRDRTVRFNPGKKNPDVLRPAGPVDPELMGLAVSRRAGHAVVGGVASFPLHADTVGGTLYSADYPLYFERGLRQVMGTNFILLFANGTCGDVNHIDVNNARPQQGQQEAERIGGALAKAMVSGFSTFTRISSPALASRSAGLLTEAQDVSPRQAAWARQRLSLVGTDKLPFLEQVEAVKQIELQSRKNPMLSLEVQVFRLAPETAIVALPGEIFCQLGLDIKAASPFKNTFVLELCNDVVNYVPTQKAFSEGSYETVYSWVRPGTGELLVQTALALLRELHPGSQPGRH